VVNASESLGRSSLTIQATDCSAMQIIITVSDKESVKIGLGVGFFSPHFWEYQCFPPPFQL
jgi:hypothetical protein